MLTHIPVRSSASVGSESEPEVDLREEHTLPGFWTERCMVVQPLGCRGKRTLLRSTAQSLLGVLERIWTNVVTSSLSEREFSFPVQNDPLSLFCLSKKCTYDFWFFTNSTWSLRAKNNKYGKHLIQNNMFIQRSVDSGRNGPPLMWSAASVCVNVWGGCCVFKLDV